MQHYIEYDAICTDYNIIMYAIIYYVQYYSICTLYVHYDMPCSILVHMMQHTMYNAIYYVKYRYLPYDRSCTIYIIL